MLGFKAFPTDLIISWFQQTAREAQRRRARHNCRREFQTGHERSHAMRRMILYKREKVSLEPSQGRGQLDERTALS